MLCPNRFFLSGMSTFNGKIAQYPFLSIDNFKSNGLAFILSHAHADHLSGLQLKRNVPLYCTEVTAKILLETKYSHWADWIRPTPYNHSFEFNGAILTFISANHCPGSAMLFVFTQGFDSRHKWHCFIYWGFSS